jgi:tetratricopeptide (TPR) repeat protein
LAQAIVSEIKIQVTPQERQDLARARTIKPDAYEAYLLANYHLSKRNPEAIEKATGYFQNAIHIDPGYAQAYAGLANTYLARDLWGGLGFGKSADQVRANTLKVLELDGDLAEGHALLGDIYFGYDWDWVHAEAEFKRAIELNANFSRAYERYAFFLQAMGRDQEALAAVHRAVELDPLSAWYISENGRILYRARRYEDAISQYQRALELDPGYLPALSRITEAYEQLGRYDEALVWSHKYQDATGDPRLGLMVRARMYAHVGKRREAVEILRRFEQSDVPGNEHLLASIYSALGDYDQAIAELRRGVQAHSFLPFVLADPKLDPLRSDPRFKDLLHRVHLR